MKWHEWKCYIDCHWESFNDAASTKQDRSHGALRVTIRSPALMHSRTQTHTDTHVKSEHSIHLCPVQLYVMPPPPHPPSPPPASRPPPHGEGDSRGVGHGAAVAAADDEVTLPEAAKGAAERGGGAMWRGGGSGVTRRAGGCNHVLTLPELLPTPPHPPTHRSSVLSLSLRSSPPLPLPHPPHHQAQLPRPVRQHEHEQRGVDDADVVLANASMHHGVDQRPGDGVQVGGDGQSQGAQG